jgi:hypothetical protein
MYGENADFSLTKKKENVVARIKILYKTRLRK